jgi:hypothetical protein
LKKKYEFINEFIPIGRAVATAAATMGWRSNIVLFCRKCFKKRPRGRIMVNIKEYNCGVAGIKFRRFSFQKH